MTESTIECPKCGHRFSPQTQLTEKLRQDLAAQFARERDTASAQAADQARREAQAQAAKAQAELTQKLTEQAQALKDIETREAKNHAELTAAKKAQAEALVLKREAEEARASIALQVEEQLIEKLAKARAADQERINLEIEKRLLAENQSTTQQLAQKDQQMDVLKRQIEALKQKAEQGSMQIQGESAEVLLETRLGQAFPLDQIQPVGKGITGADCLQRVPYGTGLAGTIIWESKNTRNWSSDWVGKLKTDMRESGADLAALSTTALPQGMDGWGEWEGVWVCHPRFAVPLAMSLRAALLRAASIEARHQGREGKMELIYDYLTGTQFRARVQAIVDAFQTMQDDLNAERRAMQKHWKRREVQLTQVVSNTTGLYGELEGIAGNAMPAIDALDLSALGGPDIDEQ